MKNVLKNSLLVFVLSGLFALPLVGFNFIDYKPEADVLGLETGLAIPADFVNDDVSVTEQEREIKVLDQVELTLSLSNESFQKFYDVIPEEYLGGDFDYLVIVPKTATEDGLTAEIEGGQMKADLVVNKSDSSNLDRLTLTILILE